MTDDINGNNQATVSGFPLFALCGSVGWWLGWVPWAEYLWGIRPSGAPPRAPGAQVSWGLVAGSGALGVVPVGYVSPGVPLPWPLAPGASFTARRARREQDSMGDCESKRGMGRS